MQRPAKGMQITGLIPRHTGDGKHNGWLVQVTHAPQASGIWIRQKRLGIHGNSHKLLDNFATFGFTERFYFLFGAWRYALGLIISGDKRAGHWQDCS